MKNSLIIAIVLLLSLLLVACTPAPTPCPPHFDEDRNSVCDKCGEEFVPGDVVSILEDVDLSSIRFNKKNVTYNGEAHSIAIQGDLPTGVSVRYENNDKVNVGEYSVVAKFYYHSDTYNKDYYIDGEDKTATLTIKRAKYDLSNIFFGGASVVYNGEAHSLSVKGALPDGVSVSYDGNGRSEVGEYTVIANFAVDTMNYETPEALVARLNIVEGPASLGGVRLEDKMVMFDGESHSLELVAEGIDLSAVTVVERGNDVSYIGENVVKLTLTVGGESATLEAKLIVERGEFVGTDGLVYEKIGGQIVVVGYTGSAKCVVIPEKHTVNNYPYNVVKIANGAFAGNTAIEYVVLPNNVTTVGNNAFRGCTSLKRVDLGSFVTGIGGLAFDGCALDDIVLPDSLVAIGKAALRGNPITRITLPFIGGSAGLSNSYLGYLFGADGYAGNALYVPETLTTVVLSDVCTVVPAYALRDCSSVAEIILGKNTSKIGISAFEGTSITEIFLPASVVAIPAAAYNYNSPFYNTSKDLVIRLEASSLPSGYGAMWCVIDKTGATATVEYGKTR